MKLHYVQYTTVGDDEVINVQQRASWHASGDAASKASTALKADNAVDRKSIKRAAIDVPTKKEELVEFLTTLTGGDLFEALGKLDG